MSQEVNVCVLFGFGINCDRETAAVFEMVGGTSERVHVNRLVQGERHLSEFETAVSYYDRVLHLEPDNAWARDARRRYMRFVEK